LDQVPALLKLAAVIGLSPLTAIDYGGGPALAAGGVGAVLLARQLNKKKVCKSIVYLIIVV